MSERISEIATVSSIDTMAVLESLIQVLPGFLSEGKIIRLGEFGTFRLTLSSDGVEAEADFGKDLIKAVRLLFRPGKLIRNLLKTVEFKKAE